LSILPIFLRLFEYGQQRKQVKVKTFDVPSRTRNPLSKEPILLQL
jgi:hypothetical protein